VFVVNRKREQVVAVAMDDSDFSGKKNRVKHGRFCKKKSPEKSVTAGSGLWWLLDSILKRAVFIGAKIPVFAIALVAPHGYQGVAASTVLVVAMLPILWLISSLPGSQNRASAVGWRDGFPTTWIVNPGIQLRGDIKLKETHHQSFPMVVEVRFPGMDFPLPCRVCVFAGK
jgi:hypothetical protein